MPFTRIDAARQVKQGAGFELPLAAGGLGRPDGIARGTIVRIGNPQPLNGGGYTATTILAGSLVKPYPIDMYGALACQATTDSDDTAIGVALADVPVNGTGFAVIAGYAVTRVATGVLASDTLYASATDGVASASSGGGSSVGVAVTDEDGGECIALIQPGGIAGTAGLQAVATVVVPGSYHSGAIKSNDQDTDGWDGSVPSGLVGSYALGFDFMQAAQHPLESFRWYTSQGGAFQDFSSVLSDAAVGSWRMQVMELANLNADVNSNSEWTINHSGDGWSIHCALLFTGIASRQTQAATNGTGTSASIVIATEPGDLVVGCVAINIASETITDGASQTRRQTGTGGFVDRLMAASTKLATSSSTTISFSWTTSGEYSMIAVVLRGNVDSGDGHEDVVGDEALYARWPHAHHVFRDYAPGVNDDADWYPKGTAWTDTTTNRTYVSTDDTVGAAVWLDISSTNPMTTAGDVIYGGAGGIATRLAMGTAGYEMTARSGAPAWEAKRASLICVFDGGGSAVAAGAQQDALVDFNCEIESATVLLDQSGSAVVDIWKDSYANYPPVDADSITASAPPSVSGAVKSQDTTLTGWSKSITAGQTLRFNVDSAATATRITVILKLRRT